MFLLGRSWQPTCLEPSCQAHGSALAGEDTGQEQGRCWDVERDMSPRTLIPTACKRLAPLKDFLSSEVMRLLNDCQQWSWQKFSHKSETILDKQACTPVCPTSLAKAKRWIQADGLKLDGREKFHMFHRHGSVNGLKAAYIIISLYRWQFIAMVRRRNATPKLLDMKKAAEAHQAHKE